MDRQKKTLIYYGNNDYRDYLAHYGILGMHWGIRRFQPYSVKPRGSGKGGKEIGEAKKTSNNDVIYKRSGEDERINKNLDEMDALIKTYTPSRSSDELQRIVKQANSDPTYEKWAALQNKISNEAYDWYNSNPIGPYSKKAFEITNAANKINKREANDIDNDFMQINKEFEEYTARNIASRMEDPKFRNLSLLRDDERNVTNLDHIHDIITDLQADPKYKDFSSLKWDEKSYDKVWDAIQEFRNSDKYKRLNERRREDKASAYNSHSFNNRFNERKLTLSAVLMDLGYPNTQENRDMIEDFVYWD